MSLNIQNLQIFIIRKQKYNTYLYICTNENKKVRNIYIAKVFHEVFSKHHKGDNSLYMCNSGLPAPPGFASLGLSDAWQADRSVQVVL